MFISLLLRGILKYPCHIHMSREASGNNLKHHGRMASMPSEHSLPSTGAVSPLPMHVVNAS
jgi:hypothetical protein